MEYLQTARLGELQKYNKLMGRKGVNTFKQTARNSRFSRTLAALPRATTLHVGTNRAPGFDDLPDRGADCLPDPSIVAQVFVATDQRVDALTQSTDHTSRASISSNLVRIRFLNPQ